MPVTCRLRARGIPSRLLAAVGVLLISAAVAAQEPEPWLPVTDEERALKDDPMLPGSQAIILYREFLTDDDKAFEKHYFRIKVLTEEGRKAADISIPYLKERFNIKEIEARTIQPNGTITPFTGQIFEKVSSRSRRGTFLAKTFVIPDVQAGSILEYRYKLTWNKAWLYATTWNVDGNYSTRKVRFLLRRYKVSWMEGFAGFQKMNLRWTAFNLPADRQPQVLADGSIQLEMENVLPFVTEEFMPPEDEQRKRVEFFYSPATPESPAEFWRREGKEWHDVVEKFIGKKTPEAITRAAGELVAGAETPEAKLRALYGRAQKLRNLSFEPPRTEQEQRRIKDVKRVDEMLTYGHGTRSEVNRFFVALARAAGFSAEVVRLAERDNKFFHREFPDAGQLDGEVALVRIDSRELLLDPGTPFMPFGMLYWPKTDTQGIRLNAEGGSFMTLPKPRSEMAVTERHATLQIGEDGSAQGTLQVTYRGYQAAHRRMRDLNRDETARRKEIEEQVKSWLPGGAVVDLGSITPAGGAADEPVGAELKVQISQFASFSGSRMLLPLAAFHFSRSPALRSTTRRHPIYFNFPTQEVDSITYTLPKSQQVEALPAAQKRNETFGTYQISLSHQDAVIRVERRSSWEGTYYPAETYPAMRALVESMRLGDESQVILQRAASGSGGNNRP